jgi:cytochrome c oxidase subunit 2
MMKSTVLLACGVAMLALGANGDAATAARQSGRPIVRITVERFSFTPSEIKLQVGDEIEIRLTSQDTAHGFRLVGFDTDIAIPKRGAGEASVIFKAEKAGRFTFECSRMCGAGHNFMRGAIVVRPRGGGGAS